MTPCNATFRGNVLNVPSDEWGASFYGSLAASGSAVWAGKGGTESRRGYWRWCLEHSIPLAWDFLVPLLVTRVV
ncbi:Imm5 family immunity protein [Burkholderia ubonensis]